MENDDRVQDWLSRLAPGSRSNFRFYWRTFIDFAQKRGKDPRGIIQEYRAAKYAGEREKDRFLDDWSDILRAFSTMLESRFQAPLTRKNYLVAVNSFLSYWKIPLNAELPKHPYVLYHNRDFSREQIRLILSRASPRDRTIWLCMVESGLRAGTATTLRYWQIQDDFEKDIIPMRILTPSESLKDHVGDRWTFIGEDGARALREYLAPRLPLKPEDYVFASERPGRMVREQFSVASLSVKFARIVRKLNLQDGIQRGKLGHYRMHGLRKYFRNNMKAEQSLREFWMGHSLGVDAHYITRDPEAHRAEYKKGYESLRILEPATPAQLTEILKELKQRDVEIQELRADVKRMSQYTDVLEKLIGSPKDRKPTPEEEKIIMERIARILFSKEELRNQGKESHQK